MLSICVCVSMHIDNMILGLLIVRHEHCPRSLSTNVIASNEQSKCRGPPFNFVNDM